MQLRLRWLIACLLALLLIAPVGMVAAGDESDDENDNDSEGGADSSDDIDDDDDKDEDERKHRVDVDISGDEIKVEMKQESEDSESKIEFKTDLSEAKFKLKFEEETGQLETEQKLEVVLQRLFEYQDANGNGGYDDGEQIISSYRIGDSGDGLSGVEDSGKINWDTPTLTDHTAGGKAGKKMSALGTFGANGTGQFGYDMMVFGDFANLASGQLKPTDVKIDFIIKHYPFEANDSKVGLLLKTKTKQEMEQEHNDIETDEEGIVASSTTGKNAISLVFAWKNYATVDGVDLPVQTTTLKSSTDTDEDEFEFKQQFVLSYARGDVIIHDPVAGVGYANVAAGDATDGGWLDSLMPGFTVLISLAAVSISALFLRPRKLTH